MTLKNKGLFTVDGYVLKIHNRPDADFGIYVFNETGSSLEPGKSITTMYDFGDYIGSGPGRYFADKNEFYEVTLVEVQPFLIDESGNMTCKSYTTQKIICND